MDAADIPTKQDSRRTGLLARVFNALFDLSAAEFNALRDGILALRVAAFATPKKITAHTLTLDDSYNGKLIECTASNGCLITVPSDLTSGFRCRAWPNHATGYVTWVAGAGVTLHNADGFLTANVRYAISEIEAQGTTGLVTGKVNAA